MKIFFSVGEPSGDIHGANLIRELKTQYARRDIREPLRCVGFGGPKMAEAGCEIHFDLTSLAVMWVLQVLRNIRTFFRLADQAEAYFQTEKPDAVILIDYPGFNWHIARRAKKYNIPVYYYSPPQVWAWRPGRVEKIRKWVDVVFSGLPFENAWLREHGCNSIYVGHPFFDEAGRSVSPKLTATLGSGELPNDDPSALLRHRDVGGYPSSQEIKMSDEKNRGKKMVALLPGSRTQEVRLNFATFLKVIPRILAAVPEVSFTAAPFKEAHAAMIVEMIRRDPRMKEFYENGGIRIFPGRAAEVIRAADVCLSVSGSVSLELLYHEKPSVITYRVARYGWWLQWYFRRVKYITLVNLLAAENPFRNFNPEYTPGCADAAEVLFPEYLSCRDRSEWMADDLIRWLTDESAYAETVNRLRALKEKVAEGGAAQKAAEIILRQVFSF